MKRLDALLNRAWGVSNIELLPALTPSDASFVERQLAEHLAPNGELATSSEIGRMIAETESVLPQRRKSDSEGAMQLEVFRRAISDIPKQTLGRAFFLAEKKLEWFPTPSQIRRFSRDERNRRENRIFIMERLLAKAGRREWPHERIMRLAPEETT